MLLRFGFQNHRSFRDRSEVSFIATRQRDEPNLRFESPFAEHGVLPVVALYGGNASGKSSVLSAWRVLCELVQNSFARTRPSDLLEWEPWRNRRSADDPPTVLDVDFEHSGVRYHYSVAYRAERVVDEQLYHWPSDRRRLLFHRGESWRFGVDLKGPKDVIRKATRPNALFLSAAAQYAHELLGPLAATLTTRTTSHPPILDFGAFPVFRSDAAILRDRHRAVLSRLLQEADLGVSGFDVRRVEPDGRTLDLVSHGLSAEQRSALESALKDRFALHLRHGTSHEPWFLHPGQESAGTSALIHRLSDLMPALEAGTLVDVDEFDTSLHPALAAAVLRLFTDPRSNPNHAQLLLTTHDSTLLEHLRRDEVALVDKNVEGVSSVRAASDFRQVRGRDDLSRAYREGRFGGVPVVGPLNDIVAVSLGDG